MHESSLARRYTRALVQTFKTDADYKKAQAQLQMFYSFLRDDEMLRMGFETYLFSSQRKREALDLIAEKTSLNERIRNFLLVLMEENRIPLLRFVIEQLEEEWFLSRGIERIRVFSAIPLDDEQNRKLRERMERILGKEVVIGNELDPGLLGGIKIQRGSVSYDFSLQGNLQRLREQIIEES